MKQIVEFLMTYYVEIIFWYLIGAILFASFSIIWCHFYNKSVEKAHNPHFYTVREAIKESLKISWLSWLGFILWAASNLYYKVTRKWNAIKEEVI